MKFQNLSVKRLFGRVAMGLVLSMSGITIALFFVTKQIAVLLTGGALLLCALVGIFVLTQAFGKRLSQFTADLCQTLDHMIAGNEAPQRPEDSETQLARIGHRLARLYQIMPCRKPGRFQTAQIFPVLPGPDLLPEAGE